MDNQITILDTCSLMNKNILKFIIKTSVKNIYIFEETIGELQKIYKKGIKEKELKYAYEALKELKKRKKLIYINSSATTHVDAAILSRVHDGGTKKNILIITEDKKLAKDILQTKFCKSITLKKVFIKKIDNNGDLIDTLAHFGNKKILEQNIILEKNKVILNYKIPETGDKVFTEKNPHLFIELPEPSFQGGEAKIYITNNLALKIFLKDKLTEEKVNKLKSLDKKNLSIKNVGSIETLLLNEKNEIIGYAMKIYPGKSLNKIFSNPLSLDTRKKIAENILWTTNLLHKHNILIGDINFGNILVDENNNVFFIDIDSYQFDNYPCYVFQQDFLPPEFITDSQEIYMRSFSNEYFSMTILIFQILLNGKHPYNQRNCDLTMIERIKNMKFPYDINGTVLEGTPKGPWNQLWSELPLKIRKMFYETFTQKDSRFTCEYWYKIIKATL